MIIEWLSGIHKVYLFIKPMQDIESRRRGRVVSSSRIVEIYFLSPSYNKIIIIRLIDTTLLLCADVPLRNYSINTTLLIT